MSSFSMSPSGRFNLRVTYPLAHSATVSLCEKPSLGRPIACVPGDGIDLGDLKAGLSAWHFASPLTWALSALTWNFDGTTSFEDRFDVAFIGVSRHPGLPDSAEDSPDAALNAPETSAVMSMYLLFGANRPRARHLVKGTVHDGQRSEPLLAGLCRRVPRHGWRGKEVHHARPEQSGLLTRTTIVGCVTCVHMGGSSATTRSAHSWRKTNISSGRSQPERHRRAPAQARTHTAGGAKRRRNLERDRHVCAIGGVPASESCPNAPSQRAVLTIGHLIPIARGTDDENNFRAEWQRFGEESRDNTLDPPTTDFVLTRARNVRNRKERKRLFAWTVANRRSPDDAVLVLLDSCRLPHPEQVRVMQESGKEILADEDG